MRQYFECSNWDCGRISEDFGKMRFKDIYKKMNEDNYKIVETLERTKIFCKDCGKEMTFVGYTK